MGMRAALLRWGAKGTLLAIRKLVGHLPTEGQGGRG